MKNYFEKFKKFFFIIFLLFFSIGINFYYAQKGLVYPDSFLHYDSGYNILNGNHPFKDFFTISGPFVDYIQSIFFYFFGVNWVSYVLHASLLNGALALFTYFLFVTLGLEKNYSLLYSASVSLIAYPSIGTPFVDYHSIIFSVFAIYIFVLAVVTEKIFYWFLLPVFIFISFLCKQIPSAYIAILIGVFLIYNLFNHFKKNKLIYFIFGAFFSISLLLYFLFLFEIDLKDFTVQYILYPLSIGEKRLQTIESNIISVFFHFKFIFFLIFSLIFLVIKNYLKNIKNTNVFVINFIILTALIFIYSQLLTQNQVLIFFLIPILLGFFHIYYFKFFKNKYFLFFLIILSLFSVGKYHFRYNENRYFLDFKKFESKNTVKGEKLDLTFKGIQWNSPFFYFNNSNKEVALLIEIKEYITNKNLDNENKFFFTNYLFFSALTNQKISSPLKFYDGVIIPEKSNKYYSYYKNYFINKIIKNKITKIYNIGLTYYDIDFFADLFQDKKCINKKTINELLIVYDIAKCKFN